MPDFTDNIEIMLISRDAGNIDEIKKRLGATMGFPCNVTYVPDLESAAASFTASPVPLELILLDMNLIDAASLYEMFGTIKSFAGDLPVIVFTQRDEHRLALLALKAGAADNITQGELASDPFKLRDAIEFALARHRIRLKADKKHMNDLTDLAAENASALRRLGDASQADLQSARDYATAALFELKRNARLLLEKEHTISWLGGGYSVDSITTVHKKDGDR